MTFRPAIWRWCGRCCSICGSSTSIPADSREAGFIETEHFGMRFPRRASRVELTEVTQRWLRDLLWDQLAESMRSVDCPRTAGWLDDLRRACLELSAFLELNAPGGGHDAGALRAEHARRSSPISATANSNGRPALRIQDRSGGPSVVTATLRCRILNGPQAAAGRHGWRAD